MQVTAWEKSEVAVCEIAESMKSYARSFPRTTRRLRRADAGQPSRHFATLVAHADPASAQSSSISAACASRNVGGNAASAMRISHHGRGAELPASHWQPVRSQAPTLLLSGARDPVTPPEGAEAVARHLPNSVHVVVPNGGHGVGGHCIQRMIGVLLDTGRVDGVDTSCVEAAPRTRFRVPR